MSILREARIMLPLQRNAGDPNTTPIETVHTTLLEALVRRHGGCTVTRGRGLWENEGRIFDEPVAIYDVAMADNPDNDAELIADAQYYGARAGQFACYVRLASGRVKIVQTLLAAVNAA